MRAPSAFVPRYRGFTLLELLVALAIFALVSAMAYSGLNNVLRARETTDAHASELAQLQKVFNILGRDIEQAANRSVRDNYGEAKGPFITSDHGSELLEFTRYGWNNPFPSDKRLRSYEQRVAYRLDEGKLIRSYWFDLDRDYDSKQFEAVLLTGVDHLELRYLDRDKHWQTGWPPQGSEDQPLPRAVEVTLELKTLDKVSRLFLVAQGTALAAQAATP